VLIRLSEASVLTEAEGARWGGKGRPDWRRFRCGRGGRGEGFKSKKKLKPGQGGRSWRPRSWEINVRGGRRGSFSVGTRVGTLPDSIDKAKAVVICGKALSSARVLRLGNG